MYVGFPVAGVDVCVPESARVTGVLVWDPIGTLVILLTVCGVGVESIGVSAGDDTSWN